MHLRLESQDGRGGQEYRIYDGRVEVRSLDRSEDDFWRRMPPDELTRHVNARTVVSEWLKKRMGWRRLLRACLGEQDLYMFDSLAGSSDHQAA
jgi:hypothetical protein